MNAGPASRGHDRLLREAHVIGEYPKAAHGAVKPLLGLLPERFTLSVSLALTWGARRYSLRNWRHTPVRASTYVSAMRRHLDLWAAGEDVDPETGVSHLGTSRRPAPS